MVYSLEVTLRAEAEVLAAANYYKEIDRVLSIRFLSALDEVYDKIIIHPGYYKYVNEKENGFRCTKLKVFPFLVIFRMKRKTVVVVSVLNTNKKNKYK